MPPKGWRKNGDSAPISKDTELVSIDDILFPRSTIQKLAKGILSDASGTALGDNMSLTKDSLIAVQRSATVFVSHMMFHARLIAKDLGRKNVNSQDILHALERADLAGFAPEIKQKLSLFELDAEAKKKSKQDAKDQTDEPAAKKLRDNNSGSVLKTGNEAESGDDEGLGDEDDTENVEDGNDTMNDDDATVLPPNERDEEEPSAPNPIALLGQEEKELGGLEPKEQEAEDPETEEEET